MPFHIEDLPLTSDIQNIETQQLQQYPNLTVILCEDFNRDIALIGRQHYITTTPPLNS
jgi:hypothetical protein